MLRDRYAPVDLFALVPAWTLRLEPELAELDRLLEDDQLFAQVKADLARRRPHTLQTGRPSTPVAGRAAKERGARSGVFLDDVAAARRTRHVEGRQQRPRLLVFWIPAARQEAPESTVPDHHRMPL